MQLRLEKVTFNHHLIICTIIRLALVVYGEIHDLKSEVPYTDIDYKVVTDGSRHILANNSPFERHTYRYSPLLAFLLIPNVILHKSFGKILFSLFDILVGVAIERTIRNELQCTFFETARALMVRHGKTQKQLSEFHLPQRYERWAKYGALFWLYNPLTMTISTRGNGDSISSFFVLATLYFLQKFNISNQHIFYAGLCHGVAVHLRLYPIYFSLAYYLSLSDRTHSKSFYALLGHALKPNKKQIFLVTGTLCTLFSLTGLFYFLYQWEYIFEAYLYHFTRKDTRHNFSLFFLMQYLNTDTRLNLIEKILPILPQSIIAFYLSLHFGQNRKTLSFCIFALSFTIVTYNTVVTSQYFVWYLAILPLCVKNLRNIPHRLAVTYFCLWLLAQALWLLPAYLLEFKTLNTFNFIGIQSVAFFFVNIFILQRFVYYFDVFSRVK